VLRIHQDQIFEERVSNMEPEGYQLDSQNRKKFHQIQNDGDWDTDHCQMHFCSLYYGMTVMTCKVVDHEEHREPYEAIHLMNTYSPISLMLEEKSLSLSATEAQ
jgi:hypothetical protein